LYNLTLIKLAFFIIVGILIGFYLDFSTFYLLGSGVVFFILFIISFLYAKRNLFQNAIFGISAFTIFIYLGFFTSYSHLPKNNPDHFTNYITTEVEKASPVLIAEVFEVLKPGKYQDRYILKVVMLNSIDVEGKLLLNVARDSLSTQLKVGQRIVTLGKYEDIASNLNPYQFDYSFYMKTLGLYKQLNISNIF
jgi:competence protein ComEC